MCPSAILTTNAHRSINVAPNPRSLAPTILGSARCETYQKSSFDRASRHQPPAPTIHRRRTVHTGRETLGARRSTDTQTSTHPSMTARGDPIRRDFTVDRSLSGGRPGPPGLWLSSGRGNKGAFYQTVMHAVLDCAP